jgi:hypothetical protein
MRVMLRRLALAGALATPSLVRATRSLVRVRPRRARRRARRAPRFRYQGCIQSELGQRRDELTQSLQGTAKLATEPSAQLAAAEGGRGVVAGRADAPRNAVVNLAQRGLVCALCGRWSARNTLVGAGVKRHLVWAQRARSAQRPPGLRNGWR